MIEYADICNHLYRFARDQNGRNLEIVLSGVPVLLIQRHEDADYVLRENAGNFRKNMAWFRQALGASRFSEDGEAWRIRRSLTHAHFTHFDRDRTCRLGRRYALVAAGELVAASAEGAGVIDDGILRDLTASVLVENFLGVSYRNSGLSMQRIAELMEHGSSYAFVPSAEARHSNLNTLRCLPALRRCVLQDMRLFRAQGAPHSDLLSDLLAADSDPDSDVVLEHELVTFLAAGAETSAASLGWSLYLLAKHPELQESLRRTAIQLNAREPNWGWEVLRGFGDLSDFVSESLRLYPPTPIVSRLAVGPDTIGDHAIGVGQNIIISFVGVQHDVRIQPAPWNLHAGCNARRGIGSGLCTAFSAGQRVCGGKHFAIVELMAVLTVFLLEMRVELISDEAPRFHWKSQMLREGGHPVRLTSIV